MTIPSINGGSPSMITLAGALDQINTQYASLESQTASGVVSDTYAGLGSDRYQALSLQPEISTISGYQQNVTTAQNTLSVSQSALTQIATIATSLQTSLTTLEGDHSASTVSAAATAARKALSTLASLANTQSGTTYVFAGTQQGAAPVTDPANILTSSTVTGIAASVAQVGTVGASAVEQSTLATASDNTAGQSLFSTALSTDATTAASQTQSTIVGASDQVSVGFVLTGGTASSSTSTGSTIRDLIRSLAIVAALPSADSSSAGFATLVSDTASSVQTTSTAITETEAQLGQTQSNLTAQSTSLSTLSDALKNQLGTVKNTDQASLATALASVKDQLTASYSLIADMKGMTLASYL